MRPARERANQTTARASRIGESGFQRRPSAAALLLVLSWLVLASGAEALPHQRRAAGRVGRMAALALAALLPTQVNAEVEFVGVNLLGPEQPCLIARTESRRYVCIGVRPDQPRTVVDRRFAELAKSDGDFAPDADQGGVLRKLFFRGVGVSRTKGPQMTDCMLPLISVRLGDFEPGQRVVVTGTAEQILTIDLPYVGYFGADLLEPRGMGLGTTPEPNWEQVLFIPAVQCGHPDADVAAAPWAGSAG